MIDLANAPTLLPTKFTRHRSIVSSLMSLFQLLLGIFDYDELFESNRVLAPLLFGAFVVLVIFILVNIFLAIINDAFALVTEQQKMAQNVGGLFRALLYKKIFRRQMSSMLSDITGKEKGTAMLRDNGALMDKIDINGDSYLDAGELETLLRQTGLYEHFTVKVTPTPSPPHSPPRNTQTLYDAAPVPSSRSILSASSAGADPALRLGR